MYFTTNATAPWVACDPPDKRVCDQMIFVVSLDVDHNTTREYFWHPSGKLFARQITFLSIADDDEVTWQVLLPE